MSEFKVGDQVRVKDQGDVAEVGWLRRGGVGTITSIDYGYSKKYGDLYEFAVPEDYDDFWVAQGRYYAHELEPVSEPVSEQRIVTVKDVNRLLKKARKVIAVEADPSASFLEYEDALKKFHNAVEEVVNK